MKRIIALLLVALLMFSSMMAFAEAIPEAANNTEEAFSQWNPDAPALNALIDYVEAVTNPDSPDFIPEVDRIAPSTWTARCVPS